MLSAPGCLLSPVAQAVSAVLNTGATLAFHALTPDPSTYEMLGVATGTGDLTATHTSTIYAQDHEDVYRGFGANEPVWEGGRVVENLLTYSEDFSNAAWQKLAGGTGSVAVVTSGQTDPDGGSAAWRLQLDIAAGTGGGDYSLLRNLPATLASDSTHIDSVWVKSNTGSDQDICFNFNDKSIATVTTTWQRIATSNSSGVPAFDICLIGNQATDKSADILIWHPQLEDASGRTDTTTPSEYCPTDTATGDDLVTNGSFDTDSDWTKGSGWTISGGKARVNASTYPTLSQNFDYKEGNYVVEVVVSDYVSGRCEFVDHPGGKQGPHLDSDGTYRFVVTADGSSLYFGIQAQLTSTVMSIDSIQVWEATTGKKVFANANGNSVASNVVTEGVGAAFAEAPWLKYQPAATNSMTYSRDLTNAAWTKDATITFDQDGITGAPNTASLVTDNSAAAAQYVFGSVSGMASGFTITHRIFIKKLAADPGNTVRVRQSNLGGTSRNLESYFNAYSGSLVVDNSDDSDVIDLGDWWLLLLEISDTTSDNSLSRLFIWPTGGNAAGASSNAPTGSITIGNVEFYVNKTIAQVRGLGPIFTEGTAVSTDVIHYEFSADNITQAETAFYLELNDSIDISANEISDGNCYLILGGALGSSPLLFDYGGSPLAKAYYGGVSSNAAVSLDANNIGAVFSLTDAKKVANVNGVYATEATYTLGTSVFAFKILYNWPAANKIRNLQRYDIPDYQTGKDKIDELMA